MYASTTTNLYNLNYAGRSHDFPLVAPGCTPLIKGFLLKKAKKMPENGQFDLQYKLIEFSV